MEESAQPHIVQSLLGIPFAEKWEVLKPTIQRLYVDENWKLSKVSEVLKSLYRFDALENQYKHKLKFWGIKKNIPIKKKAALAASIQSRARAGKATVATYKGKEVELKRIRRYLKDESRREIALQSTARGISQMRNNENSFSNALHFGNMIFMNWNLPYRALKSSTDRPADHFSPYWPMVSTPSDMMVATPASQIAAPSPRDAPSPMTVAIRTKTNFDRARLFVEGKHLELLKSMERNDRRTVTSWLYHFWLYAFSTAKYWGRGPKAWNASYLHFEKYQDLRTSANTPRFDIGTPGNHVIDAAAIQDGSTQSSDGPSPLCKWSVHVGNFSYEELSSSSASSVSSDGSFDPHDRNSGKKWSRSIDLSSLPERLRQGLENGDFSIIDTRNLPIAVNQIIKATRNSAEAMLEEALGFAIMGRNAELVWRLLDRITQKKVDIGSLYPFHLATSYLDGSQTCCNVFDELMISAPIMNSIRKLYTNHLGHTILDNLMISILKSHTSCLPVVVDDALEKEQRFVGEEVDICGRWDADSDCVRQLLAEGNARIPLSWKHMFCHTSALTICHCIATLFGPAWSPDINTPSGLFLKHCLECGLKLELFPLHTLVLVALHLSQSGCAGENLFGIIACLLCLLSEGANPCLKAHISLQTLLGSDDPQGGCTHEELSPVELLNKVPEAILLGWPEQVRIGWQLFCYILKASQNEWTGTGAKSQAPVDASEDNDMPDFDLAEFHAFTRQDYDALDIAVPEDVNSTDRMSLDGDDSDGADSSEDERLSEDDLPLHCSEDETHMNYFGRNKDLATFWAAIQTELVSYRRLEEGDSWTSQHFDMAAIWEQLNSGKYLSIGFHESGMMKPFCGCGKFVDAEDYACTRVDEACSYYFTNMEDWSRTSHIGIPYDRRSMWYD